MVGDKSTQSVLRDSRDSVVFSFCDETNLFLHIWRNGNTQVDPIRVVVGMRLVHEILRFSIHFHHIPGDCGMQVSSKGGDLKAPVS